MDSDINDLATLPNLNEAIILSKLKARYQKDRIYTYIGDIILAINPFKQIQIYSNDIHRSYERQITSSPHVFALANSAYQHMINSSCKSQCCVISGESGSGKTESTKLFIKHLMYLCDGNTRLELQILQVNPLLEAFGNAKTLMNDNSSRFGKYIELLFMNNRVVGGKISEYLLEKSRVTFHNIGEQNFHIFYYLLAGIEEKSKFYIKNDITFKYLNNSRFSSLGNTNELREKFDELTNAMNYIAFTDEEQLNLFKALIGILHIGNLRFNSNDEGYAVFSMEHNQVSHKAIASLLGIDTDILIESFTSTSPLGKNEFKRHYTLDATLDARDACSKYIYAKLFSWLIAKINQTLYYEEIKGTKLMVRKIGILDIYGFEHFQTNGFEQLCINLANEQIQYFFNKHIFALEKEEYQNEDIDSIAITFNDNQPLLDLFMSRNGILTKLDDLCKLPKANDKSLVENLNKEFSRHAYYSCSKSDDLNFVINHYAGKVMYTAKNLLEKNRDSLPPTALELFRVSKNSLLSDIFLDIKEDCKQSERFELNSHAMTMRNFNKAKLSVSAQYKLSLEILMRRMSESRPLFLRCIKPNANKNPNNFDEKFVLLQLRYCGILETTRIRKEGYSLRPTIEEFVERFKYLTPNYNLIRSDRESCIQILENTMLQNWRVGKTKVFLKYYHGDMLQSLLNDYIKKAIVIQKNVRRFLTRMSFKILQIQAQKSREIVIIFLETIVHVSQSSYNWLVKTNTVSFQPPVDSKRVSQTVALSSKRKEFKKHGDELSDANYHNSTTNLAKHELHKSFSPLAQSTSICLDQNFKWLFEKITRSQAESMLNECDLGTFLIRESDSRKGFSLSFKAESRCRHYMIESLPNGKYIIIGEPRVHSTLLDLVKYHQKNKLSNWSGNLSNPYLP